MAMLRNSGCHQGCAKMPWVAWCSWCALLCSVVGDISAPEVVVPSVAQMQRDLTWTDCGVSPWADWTACTTSCGTGTRDQGFRPLFTVSHQPNAHSGQMTRARSIATARSDKGAACPALQVPHTQGCSTGRINCACQRYRRAGRVARRPSSEGNATSGLPRTRTLARNKNFCRHHRSSRTLPHKRFGVASLPQPIRLACRSHRRVPRLHAPSTARCGGLNHSGLTRATSAPGLG